MAQPSSMDDERGLIEMAQHGDRNAYGELVCRYYPGVIRVIYRMCGDTSLAEDMAQEAFLKAWLKLASFRPGSSLRNWLYRIGVNATLDTLRRRSEETLGDEIIQMEPDPVMGPENALIEKEKMALLQDAVHNLPEAARSVLVLREYAELSYQEIAKVLDIPVGTVMSRLNYARNRLRELLIAQKLNKEKEYA